jgi:cytochrome b561
MKRPRFTLQLLRVFLVLHALMVVLQPIAAGIYLSGEVDAMNLHSPIGSTLWLITMFQFVVAVLYWRPGSGRLWPAIATVVLFAAEFTQMTLGHSRTLTVHVPLGVSIVTGVLLFTVWSFLPAARQPRPAKARKVEVAA